jgi:hypothetical protein
MGLRRAAPRSNVARVNAPRGASRATVNGGAGDNVQFRNVEWEGSRSWGFGQLAA